MSGWNFDMSQAPRSYYVETQGKPKNDGTPSVKRTLVKKPLWLAYDGDQVGMWWWLPDEERWNGFCKGSEPEAWIEMPAHPSGQSND